MCGKRIATMLFVLALAFGYVLALPQQALAQEPSVDLSDYVSCADMPDAQIPGESAGSACRVLAVPFGDVDGGFADGVLVYRSGWTHRWTSESDSDLVEDQINVDAFLYWGSLLEDTCTDHRTTTSHAACRTYGSGGGPGSTMSQHGYHFFHKSGYQDNSFETGDSWTI